MSKNVPYKIAILLLAAGASTRMGKPKQLLPWKNTTLIGNALNVAKQLSDTILVVLGANSEEIKAKISKDIKTITNIGWQAGMGTSVALGVAELEKTANPDSILVMLVDQPLVDFIYLKKMLSAVESATDKIVATSYGNRAGVPALFPKSFFSILKKFDADYGAKHLLNTNKDQVVTLNAGGKAVDLDTQANYDEYWKKHGR